MAGFDVVWANEFVPSAQASYRANHPYTVLDGRDIRVVQAAEILEATGLQEGELDLFDGSPPCQAFSMIGKRQAAWGKQEQHTDGAVQHSSDNLFFEYARLIKGLQPKVFIGENVFGLVAGAAKGYFKLIFEALEDCGYIVEARMIDASWLGVPQARRRIVFQGVRKDLGKKPVWPVPWEFRYGFAEALNLHPKSYMYSFEFRKQLGRKRRFPGSLPIPTITTTGVGGGGSSQICIVEAGRQRQFTTDELTALCSFPPDYELGNRPADIHTRLGNSVPPLMMKAIGEAVYEGVLKPCLNQ